MVNVLSGVALACLAIGGIVAYKIFSPDTKEAIKVDLSAILSDSTKEAIRADFEAAKKVVGSKLQSCTCSCNKTEPIVTVGGDLEPTTES